MILDSSSVFTKVVEVKVVGSVFYIYFFLQCVDIVLLNSFSN